MGNNSMIDAMKRRIAGGNGGHMFRIKAGDKKRVRFLVDLDSATKVVMHDKWETINTPCYQELGKKCKWDKEEDIRTRDNFAWPVYDYDEKAVKIFMFKANDKTPVPQLIAMYESYGTIIDRDFTISRTGEKFDTAYQVIPQDKAKFALANKVKPVVGKELVKLVFESLNPQGYAEINSEDDDEVEGEADPMFDDDDDDE